MPRAARNSNHVLLCLALAALGASRASAQWASIDEEALHDFVPFDVEVTPNGALTVVRACDLFYPATTGTDSVAVFDTSGNRRSMGPTCTNGWGGGNPSGASDCLRVTNNRAILVGSTANTTYIDVLDIGANPVGCKGRHVFGTQLDPKGDVGDVEITPDGALAIVNRLNGIDVLDLDTGNILATFQHTESAQFAADSIATTNDYAVVLTRQSFQGESRMTWVYIISLNGTPALVSGSPFPLGSSSGDYRPHDVAITPNEQLAVVSATNIVGVYALTAPVRAVGSVSVNGNRNYRVQADSLVVSNSRAVVIATSNSLLNPGEAFIDVISIDSELAPKVERSWAGDANYAHDLAIDEDGEIAVVSTKGHMVVLKQLSSMSGQTGGSITSVPVVCLPNDEVGAWQRDSTTSWASDSIEIVKRFVAQIPYGSNENGVKHYAVMVGSDLSVPKRGTLSVVDLEDASMVAIDTYVADAVYKTLLVDVAVSGQQVLTRASAPPDEDGSIAPLFEDGRDWCTFSLDPVGLEKRWGGKGTVWALDSLSIKRGRSASVSEELTDQGTLNSWVYHVWN
ncbi:MAG: hypothetical protein IT459_21915 [Planctomycetes bacterium]|nr:hypothetical protein [Planctomycetota bacterium]